AATQAKGNAQKPKSLQNDTPKTSAKSGPASKNKQPKPETNKSENTNAAVAQKTQNTQKSTKCSQVKTTQVAHKPVDKVEAEKKKAAAQTSETKMTPDKPTKNSAQNNRSKSAANQQPASAKLQQVETKASAQSAKPAN